MHSTGFACMGPGRITPHKKMSTRHAVLTSPIRLRPSLASGDHDLRAVKVPQTLFGLKALMRDQLLEK